MPRPGDPIRFVVDTAPGVRLVSLSLDRLPVALRPGRVGGRSLGLAGIGRREPEGPRELLVRARDVAGRPFAVRFAVPVEARPYPVDRLRVPEDLAAPPEAARHRILAEASSRRVRPEPGPSGAPTGFSPPVPGDVTSPFGAERIFNQRPRGPHLGVDLRAAAGTLVCAPAPGRVLGVRLELLGGLTVHLDHGDGWESHTMHLSEALVAAGDLVVPGAGLGRVGASGRVTGPHLHYAVSWRGRFVDPRLLPEPVVEEGES